MSRVALFKKKNKLSNQKINLIGIVLFHKKCVKWAYERKISTRPFCTEASSVLYNNKTLKTLGISKSALLTINGIT